MISLNTGFHFKLALTFSAPYYAHSERGQMYVAVTGNGGRIEETKLTKEYVQAFTDVPYIGYFVSSKEK